LINSKNQLLNKALKLENTSTNKKSQYQKQKSHVDRQVLTNPSIKTSDLTQQKSANLNGVSKSHYPVLSHK
jgi:hypothetical protein